MAFELKNIKFLIYMFVLVKRCIFQVETLAAILSRTPTTNEYMYMAKGIKRTQFAPPKSSMTYTSGHLLCS